MSHNSTHPTTPFKQCIIVLCSVHCRVVCAAVFELVQCSGAIVAAVQWDTVAGTFQHSGRRQCSGCTAASPSTWTLSRSTRSSKMCPSICKYNGVQGCKGGCSTVLHCAPVRVTAAVLFHVRSCLTRHVFSYSFATRCLYRTGAMASNYSATSIYQQWKAKSIQHDVGLVCWCVRRTINQVRALQGNASRAANASTSAQLVPSYSCFMLSCCMSACRSVQL